MVEVRVKGWVKIMSLKVPTKTEVPKCVCVFLCVCTRRSERDGADLGRGTCVSLCIGSFSRQCQGDIIVSKDLCFLGGGASGQRILNYINICLH